MRAWRRAAITSPAFGPEEDAARADQVDRSVSALRSLPEEQCRAMALAALGGRRRVLVDADGRVWCTGRFS